MPDVALRNVVLPGLLWIEGKSSVGEEDCGSKVFESSVPSSDGFYFLYLPMESFGPSIRLFMIHAFLMASKHLGNLYQWES